MRPDGAPSALDAVLSATLERFGDLLLKLSAELDHPVPDLNSIRQRILVLAQPQRDLAGTDWRGITAFAAIVFCGFMLFYGSAVVRTGKVEDAETGFRAEVPSQNGQT